VWQEAMMMLARYLPLRAGVSQDVLLSL